MVVYSKPPPASSPQHMSAVLEEGAFVRLVAAGGEEFLLPTAAVCSASAWMRRLLHDPATQPQPQQQFLEAATRTVHLREVAADVLEEVAAFAANEAVLNSRGRRTAFQFPLSPDRVLATAAAAQFLEMPELLRLAAAMLADHADCVQSWDGVPPEVVLAVCAQLSPCRLAQLQHAPSFPAGDVDLGPLWVALWERANGGGGGNDDYDDGAECPRFANSWEEDNAFEHGWKALPRQHHQQRDPDRCRQLLLESIAAERSARASIAPSEEATRAWQEVIDCCHCILRALRLTVGSVEDIHVELAKLEALRALEVNFHSLAEQSGSVEAWQELVARLARLRRLEAVKICGAKACRVPVLPRREPALLCSLSAITSLEICNCDARNDIVRELAPLLAANKLTKLSLAGNLLDRTGATELVQFIATRNRSLQLLDLSRNNISKAKWTALASHPSLSWLFLSGNPLGVTTTLRELLEAETCQLVFLGCDGCMLGTQQLAQLTAALASNTTLVSLNIARNGGSPALLTQIVSALRSNNTLTALNANMCHCLLGAPPTTLDPDDAQLLCNRLHCLELAHNNIPLDWIESLADALVSENAAGTATLQQLNLNGSPEIEGPRWAAVREKLIANGVSVLHDATLYSNRLPVVHR